MEQLEQIRIRIDQALDNSLGRHLGDSKLLDAARYSVLRGGKRLRPALVYAAADAAGASPHAADTAAIAVELLHAYSLIHDDLPAMDDDALRRGQPTTHIAFDEATAILAGDALQALAFSIMVRQIPEPIACESNNSTCSVRLLDFEAWHSVRQLT